MRTRYKYIPILTIIAVLILSGCRHSKTESAGIHSFQASENTETDLGRIRESDGPVHFKLVVKNTTGDTIRPLQTYTQCGCIEANIDRKPVPPDGNLIVSAVYNPAYRSGIFMEEIQVYYNDAHHLISLIVKGSIIPARHPVEEDYPYDFGNGLHLSQETLHFGTSEAGEHKRMFIRLANETKRKMDVEFIPEQKYSNSIGTRNIVLEKKGRDTLYFNFRMPDRYSENDTLKFTLQPYINGKQTFKTITVKAIYK